MNSKTSNDKLKNRWRRKDAIMSFFDEWTTEHPSGRVYNYSLRNYIYVKRHLSARETSEWGSKRVESTLMIINHFDEILRFAKKTGESIPKSNTGNKIFNKLIIMERGIKGIGTAKLTVGVRKFNGQMIQYCITAIE